MPYGDLSLRRVNLLQPSRPKQDCVLLRPKHKDGELLELHNQSGQAGKGKRSRNPFGKLSRVGEQTSRRAENG